MFSMLDRENSLAEKQLQHRENSLDHRESFVYVSVQVGRSFGLYPLVQSGIYLWIQWIYIEGYRRYKSKGIDGLDRKIQSTVYLLVQCAWARLRSLAARSMVNRQGSKGTREITSPVASQFVSAVKANSRQAAKPIPPSGPGLTASVSVPARMPVDRFRNITKPS